MAEGLEKKPFELRYTENGEVETNPLVLYPRQSGNLIEEAAKLEAALKRASQIDSLPKLKSLGAWLDLLCFNFELNSKELLMQWSRRTGFFGAVNLSVSDAIGMTFDHLRRLDLQREEVDHLFSRYRGRGGLDVAQIFINLTKEGIYSGTQAAYLELLKKGIDRGETIEIVFRERPNEGFTLGFRLLPKQS